MNYVDYDGINEINNVIDGLVEENQQQVAENTEIPSVSFIAGVVVPINPLQSNDPFTFFYM